MQCSSICRLLLCWLCVVDEDSSAESHDGRLKEDNLRSNIRDHEQCGSTPVSVTLANSHKDTAHDALKPEFWMNDYKQPKRCRKGNCSFQTASKVSRTSSGSFEFVQMLQPSISCDDFSPCPFITSWKL